MNEELIAAISAELKIKKAAVLSHPEIPQWIQVMHET